MKFKIGDRVILLDKTCGPIRGLRGILNRNFESFDDLIPQFGVIKRAVEDSIQYGFHYKVEVNNYSSKVYKHKELMFYEEDLDSILTEWIEDDLFVI